MNRTQRSELLGQLNGEQRNCYNLAFLLIERLQKFGLKTDGPAIADVFDIVLAHLEAAEDIAAHSAEFWQKAFSKQAQEILDLAGLDDTHGTIEAESVIRRKLASNEVHQ